MRRPWLAVPLLAGAIGCMTAGCGGGDQPSANGPLGPTFNGGYACAAVNAPGDSMSFGGLYVQNQGTDVITITRLTLAGHGMVLTGAVLIPNVRNSGVGAWTGFPPGNGGYNPKLWATRQSPDGFQLEPGKVAALVVGVAPTSRKDSTGYPVIHYTSGGSSYVWQSTSGAQLADLACPPGT